MDVFENKYDLSESTSIKRSQNEENNGFLAANMQRNGFRNGSFRLVVASDSVVFNL